jgi:hypothetical protein
MYRSMNAVQSFLVSHFKISTYRWSCVVLGEAYYRHTACRTVLMRAIPKQQESVSIREVTLFSIMYSFVQSGP